MVHILPNKDVPINARHVLNTLLVSLSQTSYFFSHLEDLSNSEKQFASLDYQHQQSVCKRGWKDTGRGLISKAHSLKSGDFAFSHCRRRQHTNQNTHNGVSLSCSNL